MPEVSTPRHPLALAALATVAMPGLDVVGVRAPETQGEDYAVAFVEGADGKRWVVRAPRRATAGAALESELRLLTVLQGKVPFAVPQVAGSAPLLEGGRALVYPFLAGAPLHPGDLAPGPGRSAALGRALAALHDVPTEDIEDAGMPSYSAPEYRERRLAEVDRAAATGQVPAALLTRWERAMEDVGRWRFAPVLTHGDLVAEHVLVDDGGVCGILDWGEAKVADPADDLAWVAVGADQDALESVLEAYSLARREHHDRHLGERARLAGELAMARWLLHGVRVDDAEIVDDAVQMLRDLEASLAQAPAGDS